jgi:D-serine deaminase-like pyridoxal phosphate-dependent protein
LNITANKPLLLLDVNRCKQNIRRMAERVKASGCEFRPHFKTHQSHEIGRWIRNEGVNGITVSSVSMARYFADDGWDDITIAFPFYNGMLADLAELEKRVSLRLFIHHPGQITLLDEQLTNPLRFYIEIDAGYGRSGIKHTDRDTIDSIINASKASDRCRFHGLYIHDGGTYSARNREEIKAGVHDSLNALITLGEAYPEAKISLGDTPSASVHEELAELDELTPGNFVFYDWMQVQIGSCSADDPALFAVLPTAQQVSADKAILHGGAVHLSKDYIIQNGQKTYGQAVQYSEAEVKPLQGSYLTALSQEHGTITGFKPEVMKENVVICPIHSCLTANLFDHYITTDGKRIEKRILS